MYETDISDYQQVISPWYSGETTLRDDFEYLSDADTSFRNEEGEKVILNFLLKYFLSQHEDYEASDKIRLSKACARLSAIKNAALGEAGLSFSESMLLDLASSADLFQRLCDIDFPDGLVLDLGTGTGILAVIAKISALKKGLHTKVLGVDIDKEQIRRSRELASQLSADVRLRVGDITNPKTWSHYGAIDPVLIINENLPAPTLPLSQEPYLEGLEALNRHGINVGEAQHFPPAVEIKSMDGATGVQGCLQFEPHPRYLTQAQAIRHLPGKIKAPSLVFGQEHQPLGDVGKDFIVDYFPKNRSGYHYYDLFATRW